MEPMTAKRAPADILVVRRHFDARPAEIFEAWVTPALVELWWGPEGFRTEVEGLDLRVGGAFRFDMISPLGTRGATAGVFRVIDPPRRLAFDMTEHCNCDLPPGAEPQLETSFVTVDFNAVGGGTEVVIQHERLSSEDIAGRFSMGWASSLGCLVALRFPLRDKPAG